ncbi:hypothetical protein [Leuconostoc carnosum]|uniref:hypothetical protein n=1 Tax=Leuconostoc carnosum TaxID=1252 RepID=UPI001680966E|nr:hypothetical protein [Leuconostoc carnosum]
MNKKFKVATVTTLGAAALLLGGALISLYDRNSDNTSTRIQIGDEMFRLNLERLDDV